MSFTRATSSFGRLARQLHMRIPTDLGGAPMYYQQADETKLNPVLLTGDQMVVVTNRTGTIIYTPSPVPPPQRGFFNFGAFHGTAEESTGSFFLAPQTGQLVANALTFEFPLLVTFSGTISRFFIASATPGIGSQIEVYTVRKNNVDTSLTTQLSRSTTPYAASSSGSVSFVPGDMLGVKVQNLSTGGSAASCINASLGYTSTVKDRTMLLYKIDSLSANTSLGWAHNGMAFNVSTSPDVRRHHISMPCSGNVRNLYVRSILVNPTGSGNTIYTLEKDDIATSLFLTMSQAALHAGQNISDTFSVVQGSKLSVGVKNTANPTNTGSVILIYVEFEEV